MQQVDELKPNYACLQAACKVTLVTSAPAEISAKLRRSVRLPCRAALQKQVHRHRNYVEVWAEDPGFLSPGMAGLRFT